MTPPNLGRRALLAALVLLAGCGADDGAPIAQPAADGAGATTSEPTASPTTDPGGTDDEQPTDPTSDPGETDDEQTTDPTTGTTQTTGTSQPVERDRFVEYRVEVVATHPHDTGAYTQGLEVIDGLLLESTGVRGQSSIRLVEPTTGEPVLTAAIDDELFGEGATVVGDEILQLTWTSGFALVHGLDDLIERRRLPYQGEGWGLCAEADRLVMSDGSSLLTLRDPATFEVLDRVQVLENGIAVDGLNELECVDGVVWANVYQTTRLVAVEPTSGRVVASADVAELVPPGFEGDTTNVANGIAHDPETGRFWLTGKRWPVLYEVELVPVP